MSKNSRKPSRSWLVFVCCLLAMPTSVYLLEGGISAASPQHALLAGALLGVAHVILRPILRLISLPLGCLTLGLFVFVIDTALIYGCDWLVEGFEVLSLPYALIVAMFVNIMCLIVGGRR